MAQIKTFTFTEGAAESNQSYTYPDVPMIMLYIQPGDPGAPAIPDGVTHLIFEARANGVWMPIWDEGARVSVSIVPDDAEEGCAISLFETCQALKAAMCIRFILADDDLQPVNCPEGGWTLVTSVREVRKGVLA